MDSSPGLGGDLTHRSVRNFSISTQLLPLKGTRKASPFPPGAHCCRPGEWLFLFTPHPLSVGQLPPIREDTFGVLGLLASLSRMGVAF